MKGDSTIHLRFTCLRLTDSQPFLEDIIIDISFSLQSSILIVELRILSSTIAQIPWLEAKLWISHWQRLLSSLHIFPSSVKFQMYCLMDGELYRKCQRLRPFDYVIFSVFYKYHLLAILLDSTFCSLLYATHCSNLENEIRWCDSVLAYTYLWQKFLFTSELSECISHLYCWYL